MLQGVTLSSSRLSKEWLLETYQHEGWAFLYNVKSKKSSLEKNPWSLWDLLCILSVFYPSLFDVSYSTSLAGCSLFESSIAKRIWSHVCWSLRKMKGHNWYGLEVSFLKLENDQMWFLFCFVVFYLIFCSTWTLCFYFLFGSEPVLGQGYLWYWTLRLSLIKKKSSCSF